MRQQQLAWGAGGQRRPLARATHRGRSRQPRVRAVLAPTSQREAPAAAGQQQERPTAPAPSSPSLWRSASQLVGGLRIWPSSAAEPAPKAAQQVPPTELQQQQQALLPPPPTQAQAQAAELLDCTAFLGACSSTELRQMRLLAHLCAQTYYMGQLTPRKLKRWHGLELITSSLCCERLVHEPRLTDEEVLSDADGMAGPSITDALEIYCSSDLVAAGAGAASPAADVVAAAATSANNVVPFSRGGGASEAAAAFSAAAAASAAGAAAEQPPQQQQPQGGVASASASASASGSPRASPAASPSSSVDGGDTPGSPKRGWNPADLVAAKLSEAAAAASAAALQPLASAAGTLYAGSLSLVSSVTSTVRTSAADRVVREAIAGIASAEIAGSHPNPAAVKAASTSAGTRCPSEWYVADDAAGRTRYFVIQGSDSLDHWVTNLMFEPVAFEEQRGLGVRVHRGAYEAALALYERFLPLVQEAVDADPAAKVCFTGHSIGGSLAVLLAVMFRARGVLLPQQVAPVYTFGAPAVFCDGALGGCSACVPAANGSGEACSLGASLLARLGLSEDVVRCVMMHRDIVPRAFSCDYTLVAELLRSWGPSWREHTCLSGGVAGEGRRQLYVHIGRAMVLQPSPELRFVTEPSHYLPLLPQRSELFELLPRPLLSQAMAAARGRAEAMRGGAALGRPAGSREEVLAAIMDTPHPLETLADPGAYGSGGSISRYHNPDHYCRALGRLLADRRAEAAAALSTAPFVPRRAAQPPPFFAPAPGAEGAGAGAGTQ